MYLIDYGLCKKYRSTKSGEHIKYSKINKMNGTAKYASINALAGYEVSRRDDLEELCYVMINLLNGKLPWEKLKIKDKQNKYKMIYNMKKNLSSESLIGDRNNSEYIEFLGYCRRLKFEEKPDYNFLRGLMIKSINKNSSSILSSAPIKNYILNKPIKQNKNKSVNFKKNEDKFDETFNFTKSVSESINSLDEAVKAHSFGKVNILEQKPEFNFRKYQTSVVNNKYSIRKSFLKGKTANNSTRTIKKKASINDKKLNHSFRSNISHGFRRNFLRKTFRFTPKKKEKNDDTCSII